jgi:hypothetical protein
MLYYHKLFVFILLVAIGGYSISGYWLIILLMAINNYFISGYWWLLY